MRPHLPLFIIFLYAKSSHFNRNPHDLADFATASSGENFTKLPLMWLHPKTGCRGKLDLLLRNLFMLVYTDHAYHNPESIFTQSFHLSFFPVTLSSSYLAYCSDICSDDNSRPFFIISLCSEYQLRHYIALSHILKLFCTAQLGRWIRGDKRT